MSMKKLLTFLTALLILILPIVGAAAEQTVPAAPVFLDNSAIIHGDLLYYSGSVDGGEQGVFVMNADGSDARRIAAIDASLLALSGSNLLVYHYDEMGDASVAVLRADGTMVNLGDNFGGTAIAANRRFYWGFSSCAEDGSDLQTYFDPNTSAAYDYHPMAVHGDYLYYLDWSEMGEVVYAEGGGQPMGAALCRLNLVDRSVETVSPLGTRFLGIEDNLIYYARDNFWYETEDGMNSAEYKVDQGLFCADLSTLSEKRLASYPTANTVIDSYKLVENGIVYGLSYDYSTEDGATTLLRVTKDGTRLPDVPLTGGSYFSLNCVENGVVYLACSTFTVTEDDFIQTDCIVALNPETAVQTALNSDSIDMLFYSESDPAVKVSGGRIYFSAYDMERWALCLKSMNLDGSDLKLLAYGLSYAEG